MKRRTLALVALPLVGCASLIGATFDDAHLGAPDAATDVVEAAVFDVAEIDAPDAAPFDPSSLPSLAFWIDATHGVDVEGDASSGVVTAWHDRSPWARDLVPAGNGTNAPTLVPNALAGRAVVHFASADLDLLRSSWNGPGGTELTMFVVARGYANSVLRFESNVGSLPFVGLPIDFAADASSPTFRFVVGEAAPTSTDLATGFDGGAAVIAVTWRTDGTAATYLDGTLVEQRIAASAALPSDQTLYVGGGLPLLGGAQRTVPFADGDVAEAIVYAFALDEGARRSVEGYLLDKWAIAP